MIVDQLGHILMPLAIVATLVTVVSFVSLFCFMIYDGWVRR